MYLGILRQKPHCFRMQKKPLIIANWKMHKTASEAQHYVSKLMPLVKDYLENVFIAAPFTSIRAASKIARHTGLKVGAQNVSEFFEGAYTGEISAGMIKDSGAEFCIVGHSERRHIFGESNHQVKEKLLCLLEKKLIPVLCIGETKKQRDEGHTASVLKEQLHESLEGIESSQIKKIMVAYEPVWAIGTGAVASPDLANETHELIRKIITENWGDEVQSTPILYGGSVKPDNAKELLQKTHIDGALVGGASLEPQSFAKIILEGFQS